MAMQLGAFVLTELSLWEKGCRRFTTPSMETMQKKFDSSSNKVLDVQFGVSSTSLKMVNAYSDGRVKVYEFLDPLELVSWLCMGIGATRYSLMHGHLPVQLPKPRVTLLIHILMFFLKKKKKSSFKN